MDGLVKFKDQFKNHPSHRIPLSSGLQVGISLFLLSLLHRFLAAPFLRISDATSTSDVILESLVGIWGDLWMSFLLAAPVFLFELFVRRTRPVTIFAASWLAIWVVFTTAHQGYVEYFRQQIIPFHLEYIFDRAFLLANNQTLVAFRSSVILITGLLLGTAIILRVRPAVFSREMRKRSGIQFLIFALFAVTAHVENIKWRVQWFVPEALQTHYLERLFANLKTKHPANKLSPNDRKHLAAISGATPEDDLKSLLSLKKPPPSAPILETLAGKIQALRSKGVSPLIAVVVAESLRPADAGWTRAASDPVSVTPTLDSLISRGISFANAYSTGPVTRGGQEAVWCGVPTATDTSLMRSFPLFKLSCVSDRAKESAPSSVFWMHGGDSRFDSQMEFWLHHHVDQFLTREDFATETPRTGWGVSDLALFREASLKLSRAKNQTPTLMLPMILSVTNHIPWDLPSDTSEHIQHLEVTHASHRTTAYFDEALGAFVTQLKASGQWQNSIVFIVSDHGGLEVVRNQSYKKTDPLKWEHLASHINLVMTGGVVEDLGVKETLPLRIDTFVSQAQVAPTIARIAGLDTSNFMDAPLFTPHSPWPVATDLNQYLFLPADGIKITKEDVLAGDLGDLSEDARTAVLRYRAFLQMLYEFKP